MSLSNEGSSVVNRSGQTEFKDLSLQSSFQEILGFQSKDVIEFVLRFVHHSKSVQSSEQGSTFKNSLRILFIFLEQFSCCSSNSRHFLGQSPQFSLVLQTILTDEFQFSIKTFLFKRSSRVCAGFALCIIVSILILGKNLRIMKLI